MPRIPATTTHPAKLLPPVLLLCTALTACTPAAA